MFTVNDDLSIYVTRGDMVFLKVTAKNKGEPYTFGAGDVLRIKVYRKKDCKEVVLQKDFPVTAATQAVEIVLEERDTKIGDVISKPVDYWYEVELNPLTNPQTIIGYDEDGARVFRLFPEGRDLTENDPVIQPEDIPIVDDALDLTSKRPVENQAIARAIHKLEGRISMNSEVTPKMFGAVGDGVADDTKAFAASVAAVRNGGTICLFDGVYRLTNGVEIAKDITIASGVITGRGLHIKGANVTLNGVRFRDTERNAVTAESNANLTIQNCRFENIGTEKGIDVTYQGCGVHASGGFALSVYNCDFIGCHGHGAVFCHNGGNLVVKDCRFDANDYRAISFFGTEPVIGVISGNYIADCGKNNTTGSGVACNGIFAPNGYGVVCENNTILRSRENAIEGAFLKIVGNYIDGTGVEIDTKPTPSNEGICYAPTSPAYVANNIVLNAGGSGIKTHREAAITESAYIIGNIVKNCGGDNAIDIGSAVGVENAYIVDNKVEDYVKIVNSKRSNVYVGDILMLDITGNINVERNKSVYDFHHYFEKLEPIASSNCTPEIVTADGEKCVRVVYDTYARLECALPSLDNTFHMVDFHIRGKGKFDVNLQMNGAYHKTIFSVDSKEFVDKQKAIGILGALSDKFKITIEFRHQADVDYDASHIKSVDVQIYR